MRAALYDHSILKHENDVRPADGGQAVCDDDAGFSGHQPVERIKNNRLRYGVQSRSGLVQNQNRSSSNDRSRDPNPLSLAAGKGNSAFSDRCVVTIG